MAGSFGFSSRNGVSLSTTQSRLLGELMRLAIRKVSAEVMEKVYFSYDLYNNDLDFSDLTQEEYMNCYNQLKHLFEIELNGEFRGERIGLWFDEIKVKMKKSPLFIGGDGGM